MLARLSGSWRWSNRMQIFGTLSQCLLSFRSMAMASNSSCRCFPGEACWPSFETWSELNRTVDGRLIATVPLGAPCHDPTYDGAVCNTLRSEWLMPEVHYNSSSSIMAPYFTNNSCSPFSPEKSPCRIGTYIDYAIDVAKPEHVVEGILFSQRHNIRLVIRNTGHDYLGKSTGAGAVGIWTHHLKSINFTDYRSRHYTGKAIKLGAGVQGIEAYEAAHAQGLVVVGGECPTVGIAGGYTQGGGHSALASKFGLAADQALEWEVITGDGHFITANRDQNSDLFWALSGGGGGTYGVIWSLTSKAHPDFVTAGANLTFTSVNISQDTYYDAIGAYHGLLPGIVDTGAMSVWSFTNTSFSINALTGPNMTAPALKTLIEPFLNKLRKLNIKYELFSKDFPSYLDEYNEILSPIFAGNSVGTAQYGGWLIPRSVVESNNEALTTAFRNITAANTLIFGIGLNASKAVAGDVYNAVLPAWRDTLIDTVVTTPWSFTAPTEDMIANQRAMTDVYIPQLKALAPDSGCYLNEGDFRQPNWQTAFYGRNYAVLRQIKAKYDPNGIFYATTAVGSEEWYVESSGRLCRV